MGSSHSIYIDNPNDYPMIVRIETLSGVPYRSYDTIVDANSIRNTMCIWHGVNTVAVGGVNGNGRVDVKVGGTVVLGSFNFYIK